LKDKEVFGFAGLYAEWIDCETGKQIETCTIITTEANKVLEPVHERMPVILKPENYDQWLDAKEKDASKLQYLLAPQPSEEMTLHKVSRAVSISVNDSPELIKNLL
jgi:putative SOS response-associated peptidase YedK